MVLEFRFDHAFPLVLLASGFCLPSAWAASSPIALSLSPPSDAPLPLFESFLSLSIEFSSFPDFAGNSTNPNTFSYNLIQNLGKLQGTNPVVRVGGNTQDYALYKETQKVALLGTIDPARNPDYPTVDVTIGPSFFSSYSTWPNTTFIHGFNAAKNGSAAHQTLLATAALACKALNNGRLAYWEMGNEADLYKVSAQWIVRPSWWDEQDYVDEWLNRTRTLRAAVADACPKMVTNGNFRFIAPSFGGVTNGLAPVTTFQDGLDADGDIQMISGHFYIAGATDPGITLSGTLLHHPTTTAAVDRQLAVWDQVSQLSGLRFSFTEANSLYNEGRPGLSNTFGAALWGVDFMLYCASRGVARVHMHQGTNYRYAAWQPIPGRETLGTKPPYYALAAVASFVGDLTQHQVRVVQLDLGGGNDHEAAYAAYVDGRLSRIAVVEMTEYNYTGPASASARPSETFSFQVPPGLATAGVRLQRLVANGSDSITGVTFNGYSYSYELDRGRPVVLANVTRGQTASVSQQGVLTVKVPWSSALIMSF